jgi:hypothetical protein
VVLLEQACHGHAVFGLELLVAAGSGRHLLTLRGLQVLHFTFESAEVQKLITKDIKVHAELVKTIVLPPPKCWIQVRFLSATN